MNNKLSNKSNQSIQDERKKCICNGSRGTDCDYCGGSGWITQVEQTLNHSTKFTNLNENKEPNFSQDEIVRIKGVIAPIMPKIKNIQIYCNNNLLESDEIRLKLLRLHMQKEILKKFNSSLPYKINIEIQAPNGKKKKLKIKFPEVYIDDNPIIYFNRNKNYLHKEYLFKIKEVLL